MILKLNLKLYLSFKMKKKGLKHLNFFSVLFLWVLIYDKEFSGKLWILFKYWFLKLFSFFLLLNEFLNIVKIKEIAQNFWFCNICCEFWKKKGLKNWIYVRKYLRYGFLIRKWQRIRDKMLLKALRFAYVMVFEAFFCYFKNIKQV